MGSATGVADSSVHSAANGRRPTGGVARACCLTQRPAITLRRPEPGQRELRIQEDELEAACWMPLAEFASNPFTAAHPIFSKVRDVEVLCKPEISSSILM